MPLRNFSELFQLSSLKGLSLKVPQRTKEEEDEIRIKKLRAKEKYNEQLIKSSK